MVRLNHHLRGFIEPVPTDFTGKGRHKKNVPEALERFGNHLVIDW